MSEKKLTPEQAFEACKALWPETERIFCNRMVVVNKHGLGICALTTVNIDWPEGVTEWPPQSLWEEPVLPFDSGKECEVSDDNRHWMLNTVRGFDCRHDYKWKAGNGGLFRYCRIDRNRYPLPEKA